MTIGFDATSILGHSGIEVYARELIRGISALQLHDAKLVLMGRRRRGKQLVEYFGDQVEVRPVIPHDVMLGYRLRPVSRVLQNIAWKANSQGVDLMHLPGNALWRMPSNRYVVTIHDVFPLMPEMDTINASRREFKSYVEATSKRAQRIIVPTQWAADSIVDYLPHTVDKIRVVHHSIREQFTHRPLNEARARELGLRIGARYLFFVGRVDPRKNLDRIISAWTSLDVRSRADHSMVFVLSGSPKDIEAFRKRNSNSLQDPSLIVHYGLSDADVIGLYSSARGLVFTSTAEGFGLPLLEAMQCGCPVLTSNTSCLPEVGGDAVLYVDPFSVEEISSGMQRLLNDDVLVSTLRQRGYDRAKQFSRASMATKTVAVYNEVLSS